MFWWMWGAIGALGGYTAAVAFVYIVGVGGSDTPVPIPSGEGRR